MRPSDRPRRKTMTRAIQGALLPHRRAPTVSVGALLTELGDRSFGWAILFFALINMIPAPYGSTLITSLPLLLLTMQMALGYEHVSLPDLVTRRRVPVQGVRRLIIRLRALTRPLERFVRPRQDWIFVRRNERLIGFALFAVAAALFIPLPLSGGIPAFAILVSALALVERDGLLMMIGLGIGAVSIVITAVVAGLLIAGVQSVI